MKLWVSHRCSRVLASVVLGFTVSIGVRAVRAAPHLLCSEQGPPPQRRGTSTQLNGIVDGLPHYSASDIQKHCSIEKGVWVSYKAGVYDITEFVKNQVKHPGGVQRIMKAAGCDIGVYFQAYPVHYAASVLHTLEGCRVGNVQGYVDISSKVQPSRCEGEGEGPAPCVLVEGKGLATQCFSVDDLKRLFPRTTVHGAIQCNNRSTDETDPVAHQWSGANLRDVIVHCQRRSRPVFGPLPPITAGTTPAVKDPKKAKLVLYLQSAESKVVVGEGVETFDGSLPLEEATNMDVPCIIAYEKDGERLHVVGTSDGCGPFRLITTPADRCCKNLKRVVLL